MSCDSFLLPFFVAAWEIQRWLYHMKGSSYRGRMECARCDTLQSNPCLMLPVFYVATFYTSASGSKLFHTATWKIDGVPLDALPS